MFKLIWPLFLLVTATAQAQDRFQRLIDGNFPSPLKEWTVREQADFRRVQDQLSSALAALTVEENRLEQKKQAIVDLGYTARTFGAEIVQRFDALPVVEQESILNDREPRFSPAAHEIRNFFGQARVAVNPFFTQLDIYIQEFLDVAAALAYHTAREQIARLKPSEREQFTTLFEKLEKWRQEYVINKKNYGLGKDTYRTTAFSRLFSTVREIFKQMRSDETLVAPSRQSWWNKLFHYRSLAGPVVGVLYQALWQETATAERVPFVRAVHHLLRRYRDLEDIPVSTEGLENLPIDHPADTITFYISSHRHGVSDQMGVASLGIDNVAIFGAADRFLPRSIPGWIRNFLIGRLNKNQGFIVVGPKAKPESIDKAVWLAKSTAVRNFLIFPEGRLHEGLGAPMAIREKFYSWDGLLARLEAEGFKIRLVPIVMPNNARLFHVGELHAKRELRAQVYPVIEDRVRRIFARLGGADSLAFLLRYGLIDEMISDEKLIWGQVRAAKLSGVLSGHLRPPPSEILCADLLNENPLDR